MLLSFIIHILVGTVLLGIAFTIALVIGYDNTTDILIALGLGALVSIPATYLITKHLRNLK